ncbi:MAG: glycosyltransferase family 4 protein [Pseudomonadota bacterium]|nr:glycosyltransferase family 4 protein [Pseudomonadota bacterium]
MKQSKEISPVVLQVLPELETGGVETGTIEIACELQKRGIKNFVASQGGRMVHELEKAGIPHLTLPLKSKNIFTMRRNAEKLAQYIKENGINIVHARSRAPAWSAYWAAKAAGVHYMTTFHGTYGLGPCGIKKLYNRVMTYGEKIIAISNHIKNHILQNYKADEKNIRLIHRCADIEKFAPAAVTPERMINKIKEYHIAEDKPVLLLPGRITHWKGQHLLLEALHLMKNKDYYCIITGDAQGRDKYLNSLKELARKYKLENRVGFFGRYSDVPALMMVSDIILSTAIEPEAFGRISVEGQAIGKIVVASDIGGSLDTIQDGITGKFFKSGDSQSLADALDWALALNDKEKQKISAAAIKNVREHFTKQIMCDKTIDVYREVVNGKK